MNIDVLKTYKVVVERGSLTAASRELGLSQPAVSMQIASLEEYFGSRLLYRTARGVELTRAGKHVLELADKFEKSVSEARNTVAEIKQELVGELRIASSNIPGMYVLPKIINEFQMQNPKVKAILGIQNTRKAIDKLLSGDVHVAAIGEKIINDSIEFYSIKKDQIVLIAPIDYDTSSICNLSDIINEHIPLVRRSQGSATFKGVNCFLKKHGLSQNEITVVSEYNSVIPQINSVAAGSGLAFVSFIAAKQVIELKQVKVVNAKNMSFERDLYIIIKKTGDRCRIGEAFWNMCLSGGKKSD